MKKDIYLIGDVGHFNNHTLNIFNTINQDSLPDDCIILLGDNFYPYGIENENDHRIENLKFLGNEKIPIYPVLGNHDYLGNPFSQLNINLKNWNFERFFYKKTFFNCDVFFIDSVILQPNYSSTSENLMKIKIKDYEKIRNDMILWLKNELEKSNNTKIVVGHYPLISLGVYGMNKELFEILINLFEKTNVRLYVSGHDHNLQICNITNYKSGYSLKHIVSGSGSDLYEQSRFFKLQKEGSIFFKNGFVRLSLDERSNEIIITFIDEDGNILTTDSIKN